MTPPMSQGKAGCQLGEPCWTPQGCDQWNRLPREVVGELGELGRSIQPKLFYDPVITLAMSVQVSSSPACALRGVTEKVLLASEAKSRVVEVLW